MAYVIVEPCIGTKDGACPVDCIHPKKNTTFGRPTFDDVPQLYMIPWNASIAAPAYRCVPGVRDFRAGRPAGVEAVEGGEGRQVHARGVRQAPKQVVVGFIWPSHAPSIGLEISAAARWFDPVRASIA